MEAHLISIDYQIRQLQEIDPVTTLFGNVSQDKTGSKIALLKLFLQIYRKKSTV
jgi:microcystin synthetase protein McyA